MTVVNPPGVDSEFDDPEWGPAANVGVAFSTPGAPWAVHPEFGFLIPIGSDDEADGGIGVDYVIQFGIAFHFVLGAPAAAPAPAADPVAAPPPAM